MVHYYRERRRRKADVELNRLSSLFGLTRYQRSEVGRLFFSAWEKGLTSAISYDDFLIGLIYHVGLETGSSLTIYEMGKRLGMERRTVFRCYRRVKRRLGLPNIFRKPFALVKVFAGKLGLKPGVTCVALEILEDLKYSNPRVGAAAAIYLACKRTGNDLSARKIKKATGVSEFSTMATAKKNS